VKNPIYRAELQDGKFYWFSNIIYMTRKVMKGSVIVDHLVVHAMEDYGSLNFDFPDEDVLSVKEGKSDCWVMYFNGAVNVYGNGDSAVIISPDKK